MYGERCGARLLALILIILAWTRTARNKNTNGAVGDAGSRNAYKWVMKNKWRVFVSALKCTVWNSPLPKPKWAASTSLPKKTAAAPTATNTLTRTVQRRSHWAGETGFQIRLNKQHIRENKPFSLCTLCTPTCLFFWVLLSSVFLKPIHWHRCRESKLPPWTQPGQEEVWDWICKSPIPQHFNRLWALQSFFLISQPLFFPPHSTRAMLPLACPSSTSAMPSWAVASWVCPTQWPTLASPYLCEFFFSISAFHMQAGRGRKWWFYADPQQIQHQRSWQISQVVQSKEKRCHTGTIRSWGEERQMWFCLLCQGYRVKSLQMLIATV